jgi:hypothetical protein
MWERIRSRGEGSMSMRKGRRSGVRDGEKEKRVGERMEEGELWTENDWKEVRREKGVGWGGGSGQRKGGGE